MFNIDINDFSGFKLLDVFGLMYDYKKIILTGIIGSSFKNIKNIFDKYNLKYEILNKSFDSQNQNKTYIISKKEKYLKQAVRAYKFKDFSLIGSYLGYPICCIEFYCRNCLGAGLYPQDFIRKIYHNSKYFYWKLNNILNFEGRIKRKMLEVKFSSFIKKMSYISLISHSPCSYNCRQSLRIADLNYRFLYFYCKSNINDYAILRKPVFFIDDLHFIIFEGYSKENYIKYNKLLLCFVDEELKNYLLKGNIIKIDNNLAVIFKGRKKVFEVKFKEPILFFRFDKPI